MRQVAGKRRNRVFFEGRQRSTDGGLPPLMRPSRILPTRGRFLFHRRGTTDRVKNGRSLGQRAAMIDRPCQSNRLTSVGIPTAGCFGKSESTPRDAGERKEMRGFSPVGVRSLGPAASKSGIASRFGGPPPISRNRRRSGRPTTAGVANHRPRWRRKGSWYRDEEPASETPNRQGEPGLGGGWGATRRRGGDHDASPETRRQQRQKRPKKASRVGNQGGRGGRVKIGGDCFHQEVKDTSILLLASGDRRPDPFA